MQLRPIGQIIKEETNLSEADLQRAIEIQKKTREPLAQLLVNMGLITQRDKARCLGKQWGMAFVDLSEKPVDKELIKLVPRHLIQRWRMLPVAKNGKKLMVAMANPLDILAIDQLRLVTGLEIEAMVATEEDIDAAISQAYSHGEEIGEAIKKVAEEMGGGDWDVKFQEAKEEELSLEALREMVDDAPIVRLVNLVIKQALRDKASDIHVQPEANRVRIRYRVDGILHDSMVVPKAAQAPLVSRIKVMAEMDIAEKRTPQDGRLSLIMERKEYDFRVSTYPGIHGEKVVMRILDKSGIHIGLHKLGMPSVIMEEFENLISRSYGIITVTGPTGSGKSTTLYSALVKINHPDRNILTIEDPVEYQLPGVTQAQVNERAGVTFATALRTMLRQDPNVILVGEIRDVETAQIAVEAALTGHLVLSTMHTNDAPGAVARLIEMGMEPFLVASSLIGVVAQRLVRVICSRCKQAYSPPVEAMKRLNLPIDLESATFYRGAGCPHCLQTGYKGRIGVFELMVINDAIRDLILKRAPTHVIRQEALDCGMVTLKQDAMQKILEGVTTMEEALRVIYAD